MCNELLYACSAVKLVIALPPDVSLTQFPENYYLCTHFKGKAESPRKDSYLYGMSSLIVFRFKLSYVGQLLLRQDAKSSDPLKSLLCMPYGFLMVDLSIKPDSVFVPVVIARTVNSEK